MKRHLFLIATFVMAAFCFSSCQKEETENNEATLSDFAKNYSVEVTQYGAAGLVSVGTYNGVLGIQEVKEVYTGYESQHFASFTFNFDSPAPDQTLSTLLNKVKCYTKGGYMYPFVLDNDAHDGKILFFKDAVAYHTDGSFTATAYFINKGQDGKTLSLETLLASGKVEIKATRK